MGQRGSAYRSKADMTVREVVLGAWARGEDPRLLFADSLDLGERGADERARRNSENPAQ